MAEFNEHRDKRRFPRIPMDWPLEYRVTDGPDAYGGMVVDGSEVGLRIQSIKNLPIGTKLKIAVMFPKGFEMTNFDVLAEIVWKDLYNTEGHSGYQYGLKFIHIKAEDLQKLRQLLEEQVKTEKISRKA
jgi:hypothetical protein